MLDFTLPNDRTRMDGTGPSATPVLADILASIDDRLARGALRSSTAETYRAAIRLLARKMNRPVRHCPADLDAFDARFPRDGFDPDWHASDRAYRTWRNRARAALETALTRTGTDADTPDIEDDWSRLLAAIEPLTKDHPTRWRIAPQKLIALRRFARTCRAHGRQPRDLDLAFMLELETLHTGNLRRHHRTAARRLDEWRAIPELRPFLPPRPIGFDRRHHAAPAALPPAFMAQVEPLIAAATRKDWDPVAEEYTIRHDGQARVARAAFRTFLRVALATGVLNRQDESCLPAFLDPDRALPVLRALLGRADETDNTATSTGKDKADSAPMLTPRSVRKYIRAIAHVLRHAGHDVAHLDQVLRANRILRRGARADREMTPDNRKFCERLLARRDLQALFLTSYLRLREAAEAILATAEAEGRPLSARERSRACILGMCAAFAALEIAGAPLRIENVIRARMIGEDAWIRLPDRKDGPIRVHVPAEHTKARLDDIRFEIRPDRYRGHETILWYVRRIRPLIPGAEENPPFPALARRSGRARLQGLVPRRVPQRHANRRGPADAPAPDAPRAGIAAAQPLSGRGRGDRPAHGPPARDPAALLRVSRHDPGDGTRPGHAEGADG